MKTDQLDQLFERLEGQFDTENPDLGHELRFLKKLEGKNDEKIADQGGSTSFWKPYMSIAASVVIILGLTFGLNIGLQEKRDLAHVSPEMANTQQYFNTAINAELEKLTQDLDPEYQDLIVDAMFQIKILEEDYQLLRKDLEESGDDRRVINAMISNFQSRIDILTNVTDQIEDLQQQN